jgi:DUF1365 family protein
VKLYISSSRNAQTAIVMAVDACWKQPHRYVRPVSFETARRISGSPESKERAKQFFREHDDVLRSRNV